MKDEYLKFKEEYTKKTNGKINKEETNLINSFVEYYGEEYREIITKRFQRIAHLYYIDDIFVFYTLDTVTTKAKELINMSIEFLKILGIEVSEEQIKDFSYKTELFNFLFGKQRTLNMDLNNLKILSFEKKYENISNKIEKDKFIKEAFLNDTLSQEDNEKINKAISYIHQNMPRIKEIEQKLYELVDAYLPAYYIVNNHLYRQEVTNENFLSLAEEKIVGSSIKSILEYPLPKGICAGIVLRENSESPIELNLAVDEDCLLRIIGLPVFCINDIDLIQEINHAIRSQIIGRKEDKEIEHEYDEYIIKSGLMIDGDDTKKKIEQLINGRTALEIHEIFKRKYNGTVFKQDVMRDVVIYQYEKNHRMIEEFYTKYKDIIKEASLTNDMSHLLDVIGIDNFERLCDFVNKNQDNEEFDQDELNNILFDMENYKEKVLKKTNQK